MRERARAPAENTHRAAAAVPAPSPSSPPPHRAHLAVFAPKGLAALEETHAVVEHARVDVQIHDGSVTKRPASHAEVTDEKVCRTCPLVGVIAKASSSHFGMRGCTRSGRTPRARARVPQTRHLAEEFTSLAAEAPPVLSARPPVLSARPPVLSARRACLAAEQAKRRMRSPRRYAVRHPSDTHCTTAVQEITGTVGLRRTSCQLVTGRRGPSTRSGTPRPHTWPRRRARPRFATAGCILRGAPSGTGHQS